VFVYANSLLKIIYNYTIKHNFVDITVLNNHCWFSLNNGTIKNMFVQHNLDQPLICL